MHKALIPLLFLCFSPLAADAKSHEIAIEINIKTPQSSEFDEFAKSVPERGERTETYDQWKRSFINSMEKLIELVESEKISDSHWTVKIDEPLHQIATESSSLN